VGDFPEVKINKFSSDLSIKIKEFPTRRRPQSRWIPNWYFADPVTQRPFCIGYQPDTRSQANMVVATIHRFGCDMDGIDRHVGADVLLYAKSFIHLMDPVHPSDLLDFDSWLKTTPYNEKRKAYLKNLFLSTNSLSAVELECKMFPKDEFYEEPKNCRAINSYSDTSKVWWGRYCQAIDKRTFAATNGRGERWFMKQENPKGWSDILFNMFGEDPVMTTDYTSFEAHHRSFYSRIIYYWLMHMSRPIMDNKMRKTFAHAVLGTNVCKGLGVTAKIPQRLMSGAMWTSSANGFLNLILTSYLVLRSKHPNMPAEQLAALAKSDFRMKAEGDDGIASATSVDPNLIKTMGLKLKYEFSPNYRTASFCSIVCTQSSAGIVKDPRRGLRNYFMIPTEYRTDLAAKAYLRDKSLCHKYCFNDSPIIGPLAHRICDLTRSIDPRSVRTSCVRAGWQDDILALAMRDKVWRQVPKISTEARLLVERKFNVSIATQLSIEEKISKWDGTSPIVEHLWEIEIPSDYINQSFVSTLDPVGPQGRLPHVLQTIFDDRGLKSHGKLPPPAQPIELHC
jgi:hypothetical protein